MIESCYGLTSCPKCGKMVVIVISPEWAEAQYLCTCGSAFKFKSKDDKDG